MLWDSLRASEMVKNEAEDLIHRASFITDENGMIFDFWCLFLGDSKYLFSEVQEFRIFWRGLPLLILFIPYWFEK